MIYETYSVGGVLYHHGISGMHWGVRNGPPYPLSKSISTGSRLKSSKKKIDGNKQSGIVSNYKMKRLTKYNGKMINKIKNSAKTDEEKDRRLRELDKEVNDKAMKIVLKSNGLKQVGKSNLYEGRIFRSPVENVQFLYRGHGSKVYEKDAVSPKEMEKYLNEVKKNSIKVEKEALSKLSKYKKYADQFTDLDSEVELYEMEPNGTFNIYYNMEDGKYCVQYDMKNKKSKMLKNYYDY